MKFSNIMCAVVEFLFRPAPLGAATELVRVASAQTGIFLGKSKTCTFHIRIFPSNINTELFDECNNNINMDVSVSCEVEPLGEKYGPSFN
jgi:hypothetical protein